MTFWLLLVGLLGFFTYFIIKRNIAPITRIPLWIFWVVMMAPSLILTAWFLLVGSDKVPPSWLVIGSLILSLVICWSLIAWGRTSPQLKKTTATSRISTSIESNQVPEGVSQIRPITAREEATLRNCFSWNIYHLEQLDYRPQAILCRGKLRTVPEVAYQTIKENIERVFGDRFLVLLQETFQGEPFFALVQNPWSKSQEKVSNEPINRPLLALALLLLTFLTTTIIGVEISGITVEQIQANANFILKGLPYSLGVIAILGVHELSHYFTAIYYKIRTTLPYFIPIPFFLGTFGAFIQMRSPVPNRKALFDVAIAGPLGGFIVTLPVLIWGLYLSQTVPIPEKENLLNFAALDPRSSFLFSVIAKIALGHQLVPGIALNLHPLAVAGYIGLIVTALNLMPVGQLDGGHIVHAMFGQRIGSIIGQFTRLLVLLMALVKPEFFLWAIFLFLMPIVDQPALNDVTELDDKRDFFGLFSLALLISIMLPLPGAIAQWLNL